MQSEWDDSSIVEEWAKAMWPYGDDWRMALINPVVVRVAKGLAQKLRQHPDGNGAHGSTTQVDDEPLDVGLVWQRDKLKPSDLQPGAMSRALKQWHDTILGQPGVQEDLKGLRVLDVGCGEGYLSRLLTPLGASYLGIDVSGGLLNIAREGGWKSSRSNTRAKNRAGSAKNNQANGPFFSVNLEGNNFDTTRQTLTDRVKTFGNPHLVVMSIVLDHLNDPKLLLNWMSRTLGTDSPHGALLLFVLNRDYFQVDEESTDKSWLPPDDGELTLKVHAKIHSANQPVDVLIRSKRRVEGILRDSRFRIAQSTPLYFPLGCSPEMERPHLRGIAPFIAFLARPLPLPDAAQDIQKVLTDLFQGEPDGPLKALSVAQKAELESHATELEVVTFGPRHTVFCQHNLGGDFLVVLTGRLELRTGGEITLVCEPGKIFGDLETGSEGRAGCFLYPVIAGTDGARALRIPASVVRELVDKDKTLGMSLFCQLRDRLAVWNWISCQSANEKLEIATKNCDLLMKGRDAVHVSRVLLAGSEEERHVGVRDSEGQCVFIDSKSMQRWAGRVLKADSDLECVIRQLTVLGIVDSFPGKLLMNALLNEVQKQWTEVVSAASEKFLNPLLEGRPAKYLGSSNAKDENNNFISTRIGELRSFRLTNPSSNSRQTWPTKHFLEFYQQLKNDRAPANGNQHEWEAAVIRWAEFLAAVNSFWHAPSTNFFYIHDPLALRAFVLDATDAVNERVTVRYKSNTAGKKLFKDAAKPKAEQIIDKFGDGCTGRLHLYTANVQKFFLADLKHADGRLFLSGNRARYLEIPEWRPKPQKAKSTP